jgi:hypothetical protein
VGVDQHRKHAERLVLLDETHAAHVRGKVKDLAGAFGGGLAVLFQVEVERQILDIVEALIPFVERLDVYCADAPMALAPQVTTTKRSFIAITISRGRRSVPEGRLTPWMTPQCKLVKEGAGSRRDLASMQEK